MGKIVTKNQPCTDTNCGSSDAMQVYEDGTTFCFSCKAYGRVVGETKTYRENDMHTLQEIATFDTRGIKERSVEKEICEFYGVKVGYSPDKEIIAHYYPYGVGEVSGYKVRELPKSFSVVGKVKGLFGQSKFQSGGRMLVITEGEVDALVVQQAWKKKYNSYYPTVSIASATWMEKELLANREWIRSFEKVVLWLDNDKAGSEAVEKAAKIIGYDKVAIVKSAEKDADLVYKAHGYQKVIGCIYDAKRYSPAGILSSSDTWDKYKAEANADYIPWAPYQEELNKQNYGRRLGSLTMVTSGTGMGKTSWIKEDQYYLHQTRPSNERIGVCSLEESIHEAVINIMALHANKRIQLPDVEMSEEEERKLWEETMGTDRFMFLDHQGSLGDSSLIDKIEFMALSGCKFIYLDHITIAVSESEESGVNSAIDRMMSDLLKLAKRHNVWICVVSHLRKTSNNQKSFEEGAVPSDDDLKGSGSLKQVPMQIFAISRNKMETDPMIRHTSRFWVLKDRFTGRTGPAGSYRFVEETGRLVRADFDGEFEKLTEGL